MTKVHVIFVVLKGGVLKPFDHANGKLRTKNREIKRVFIRRLKRLSCGTICREIPVSIFSRKHYEMDIIVGVLEGLITSDALGFEDYPCKQTMTRWRAQKSQLLL